MKISKYSIIASLGAAMLAFFGCTQAEIEESKAIIPQETEFVLPAAASEQPFTIYADGKWTVDVNADWLSVNPTSGQGTMDITLTAEENAGDVAREAKITIQGSSLMSDVEILITQKMDRFRAMSPISVTEALALEADALAKIGDAQVMALTSNGFIISDGASNMFVEGKASVAAGDKLTVTGDVAAINGITALKLDEATVSGNSEVTYPEPKVVDESYVPAKVEYVKVAASYLSGGKLSVNGKQCAIVYKSVKDLSALVGHEVELVGYCVGIDSKLAALVVLSYTDNGKTPIIGKALPFRDNFDWVAPFVQWDKDNGRTTGDSMGSKATVNYGNAYAIPGFEDMFTAQMGYESMFYSSKTVYVCGGNYLKFSKTNNCNGVRLPAFAIEGTDDLRLTFDWGKNDTDAVELEVEIEGKGTIDGASKSAVLTVNEGFTWKNEVILINGATSETRICIRPTTYTGAVASDGKLYRWFLDNVEVVSMAGMKEANIEVTGADNNLITFEGLEPEAANLTVTSDSDFTVNCTASWLHLDVTEGLAGEPTAIVVSCDPSDLSVMRKDEITIKSGLSEKKIQVVQSAAGQLLEPFISIAGGNSITVDGLEGQIAVKVQSNVPYEWSTDANWLTLAPATKSAVTLDELSFTKAANAGAAPRVANLKFYNKEYNIQSVLTITQLPEYATLPVKWTIRSSSNFASTWPVPLKTCSVEGESGYVNSTTGFGTIWYNNASGVAADTNGKCLLDVNDASPRVQGAWKGDYCQFKVPGKVNAGKKVRISFETRVSKTNPKYWLLQYFDGTEWKDACETKTAEVEGEGTVKYSHQMAEDGKTNIKVDATVTYANTTDSIIFRFICQTTMQASGSGCLSAPNGGTWRLSVTNKADDDEWQPTIQFVD